MATEQKRRRYAEPYRQPGSILRIAFLACQKGISETDLVKLIKSHGGGMGVTGTRVILKIMKRGHDKDFRWDVDDSKGRIKITNVRVVTEE